VVFEPDTSTAIPGLFVAGEDSGGVHGANRLGGNGVANSTVFGRIAGTSMARYLRQTPATTPPVDQDALEAARVRASAPLGRAQGNVSEIRDRLSELMWTKVGILRDSKGLDEAIEALGEVESALDEVSVDASNLAYNLTWHDWLNLKSMITVSRSIAVAALARTDSRGAHYRTDHPDSGAAEDSTFSCVRQAGGTLEVEMRAVDFTRVKPGQTLLADAAD